MRRVGHPSEVAAAIAFLAVNAVAFSTGETLFVDDGASLGTLSKSTPRPANLTFDICGKTLSNMESSTHLYDRPRQPESQKKQSPEL